MMKFKQFGGLVFSVMFFVLLVGCSDDSTGPEVIENSVVISSGPEGVISSWSMLLPSGTFVYGSGDTTMTEMEPGTYNLNWSFSAGWSDIPEGASEVLQEGENITFSGDYGYYSSGADTPDILMSNFKIVYELMSPGLFMGMLSPDYRTIILQDTFDDWQDSENPLAEMYFDYDMTATIHWNLFTHLGGFNEEGSIVPPIESISVSVLDKDGVWEPVDDADEYFGGRGAFQARYNLLLHFYKADGNRYEVDRTIIVYTVQGDNDLYYLLGIQEQYFAGQNNMTVMTDNVSYAGVLALYR